MPRSPQQAIEVAQTAVENRTYFGVGSCLRTIVGFYDVFITPGPATATQAYYAVKMHGSGEPPPGAVHWWTGGSRGAGHITLGANEPGQCYSTDFDDAGWLEDGRVHYCSVESITRHAPALDYRGWSYDLNGYLVVPKTSPISVEAEMILFRASPHTAIFALVGSAYKTVVSDHQYKVLVDTLGSKAPQIHYLPTSHEWYGYKTVDLSKIAT